MVGLRRSQIENRSTYLAKKKSLEKYSGSEGFAADLKKIQDEREKANAAARAACKARIDPIFKAMHEANAKRKIEAPSDEEIRILTAVSMMDKPSKTYMDFVANSLTSSLSLYVLDDLIRKAWRDEPRDKRWTPNYSADRTKTELEPHIVVEAIKNLQRTCYSILEGSGASRFREMSAETAKKRHGSEYDPDLLPQEPEYTSQKDFYDRELSAYISPNGNMISIPLDLFRSAVNGSDA